MTKTTLRSAAFSVLALAILALPALASAVTLLVENVGTDSPSCGSVTPCRSISQALANATNGDKISVGPGYYGDINQDYDFDDPGDESAEINTGCYCVVNVNKGVEVFSRDGGSVTVIDAEGLGSTVSISAPDAIFGKKNNGFTLMRTTNMTGVYYGVYVSAAATNASVGGNLLVESGGIGVKAAGVELDSNRVVGTNATIYVNAATPVLTGNLVIGGPGIEVDGADAAQLKKNVAIGSGDNGFFINASSAVVMDRNAAIGNSESGVRIDYEADVTIKRGSIFGNTDGNCGVINYNDIGVASTVSDTFWGSPAGPGPDPADQICGTGTTNLDGVAPNEITVKPKPFK